MPALLRHLASRTAGLGSAENVLQPRSHCRKAAGAECLERENGRCIVTETSCSPWP